MCFPLESIIKGFYCECRKYVSIHAEKVVMFQTSWQKTLAIKWYQNKSQISKFLENENILQDLDHHVI